MHSKLQPYLILVHMLGIKRPSCRRPPCTAPWEKQPHADLMPTPCNWLVGMVLTYLDATPAPPPRPAGRPTGGPAPGGAAAALAAAAESLPASTGKSPSDPAGICARSEHKQAPMESNWPCSTSSSTVLLASMCRIQSNSTGPTAQAAAPMLPTHTGSTNLGAAHLSRPLAASGHSAHTDRLPLGDCTPQQASCSSWLCLQHML